MSSESPSSVGDGAVGASVSSRTDSTTQAPSSPTIHPVQHRERRTEKKKNDEEKRNGNE